jgi:hypothetical protein
MRLDERPSLALQRYSQCNVIKLEAAFANISFKASHERIDAANERTYVDRVACKRRPRDSEARRRLGGRGFWQHIH